MKKAFSIIALCMAIILCIPAVPALASNDSGYILYLTNSGNNYTGDLKTVADALYSGSGSIDNSSNSIVNSANYINGLGLDEYIVVSYNGGFDGSGFSDYQIGLVSFDGISDGKMYVVQLSYGTCRHVLVTSSTPFTADLRSLNLDNYSSGNVTTVSSGSIVGSSTIYCVLLNYYNGYFNESMPNGITNNMSNSNMVDIRESNNACFIRYSSLPIYSIFENSAIGLRGNDNTYFYFSNYVLHLFDDFDYTCLNEKVNALTLNGIQNGYETNVNPSPAFSDTSYNGGIAFNYQQTHLYTQYNNAQGANETCVFKWALDERSRSITQTSSDWLMHYYVIVFWHWTQATDSSVYTPLLSGGSGGQMAFEFDAEPDFIMQGQTEISIWDLVQHVPTISSVSDEDIVSLAVAVSCLNGNIVNSVWRDIFGQSGQYVGDVASEIISGGKLEVQGVGEFGGSFINNLFNPAYYYALDDLRIKLVAHPWSGSKNIHGGNGDFDLNLRSNDSYGTTQGYVDDGGTPDNPADDTQYPTNTVPQQNNVVVPVTYPTSGGNVTVYSVVQVPDSGGGGGNSINYSPTFSPSIVMDSGLDDLKETVDAYPQVPNQHFWDYFLVFKDNAFLDATSDFFGALPSELSSLLISSIGIIGVFAIYRFVRRR